MPEKTKPKATPKKRKSFFIKIEVRPYTVMDLETLLGYPVIIEPKDLYTVEQAADYLGLALATVQYHIYKSQELMPMRRIGKTMVFTRAILDDFKQRKRPAHRPKQIA